MWETWNIYQGKLRSMNINVEIHTEKKDTDAKIFQRIQFLKGEVERLLNKPKRRGKGRR